MSQTQVIDDSKVNDALNQLTEKLTSLGRRQQDIRDMVRALQKIQTVVIRTDIVNNVRTPVTAAPMDPDTGVPMTDARRLEIYNAVMPRIQSLLGITTD